MSSRFFVFMLACVLAVSLFLPSAYAAEEAISLRRVMEEKTAELKKIQDERAALERELQEVSKTKNVLTKDVRTLENNIRQLDLSVAASKLTVENLAFEIEEANRDARTTEERITEHKETVGTLLRELQRRDRDTLLLVFLKHRTLGESVSDAEALTTLNNDTRRAIAELQGLQQILTEKARFAERKKREAEIERANLVNRQFIVQDKKEEKQRLLQQTKSQEKVYEERIEELERQQSEISGVIEEAEQTLRAAFDPTILPLKRPGVLAFPVQDPTVTQEYGRTRFAARAYKTQFHSGVDFGARIGTPIFAVADGTVKAADNNDRGKLRWQKYQYGMYVLLDHPTNLATLYAHLSRIVVRKGQEVKQGDLIGYSGNTGYATGPHLHFGVYWAPSIQLKSIPPAAGLVPVGVTIDPDDYLPS